MALRIWVVAAGLFLPHIHGAAPDSAAAASSALVTAVASQATDVTIAPGAKGPLVIRAQILLDRARFSPGEIDGVYGEDLGIAVKGFEERHHLKATGTIDAELWKLLDNDSGTLLIPYTVTALDERGPFEKLPKDVHEQARLKSMHYESPSEELAERFHVSPQLLERLNPGKDLTKAGESLVVPNVLRRTPAGVAVKVVVSKSERTVTALGPQDRVLAQYPATIGSSHDPLPIGEWKITNLLPHPWFVWSAEHFWDVDLSKGTARLPPGPNNPAGAVWMGLSKEHYGIHGSPEPGAIRHEDSHGCIRLTNWDAEDLSHMVRRGSPVSLVE